VSEHEDMREELEDTLDGSRRDFINKAMTAAGGAAVAGLIASAMSGQAEAQPKPGRPNLKEVGVAPIRFQSLEKSRTMEMASKDIARVLAAENMIPANKAEQLASVTLSVSWD